MAAAGPARNTTVAAWLGTQVAAGRGRRRYSCCATWRRSARPRAPTSGPGRASPACPRRSTGSGRHLRTFRDERGRLLLDLPDAPLPDPDIPAPPRFLPAFDNAVLGYDDRSRIIDAADRGLSVAGARFLLLDGRVAATWTVDIGPELAVLRISPLAAARPVAARAKVDRDGVEHEGDRLLEFLAPPGTHRRIEWAAG